MHAVVWNDGTLYAATAGGLGISTDGGTTFATRTVCTTRACGVVTDVTMSGPFLYVATFGGLGISTDGGATFTLKTSASGLGSNRVHAIMYVPTANRLHAATENGWSISDHGGHGMTFTNFTRVGQGLPSVGLNDLHVLGNRIYLATTRGLAICT